MGAASCTTSSASGSRAFQVGSSPGRSSLALEGGSGVAGTVRKAGPTGGKVVEGSKGGGMGSTRAGRVEGSKGGGTARRDTSGGDAGRDGATLGAADWPERALPCNAIHERSASSRPS